MHKFDQLNDWVLSAQSEAFLQALNFLPLFRRDRSFIGLFECFRLSVLVIVHLLDAILNFLRLHNPPRSPSESDTLDHRLVVLDLLLDGHFDPSSEEAPDQALDLGCRVKDVLLEVSLLSISNIGKSVLHAKYQ